MSRQPRGGGTTEVARGAGYAAFLGAVLIGVAVIIGIVLLQIGDRNDNGPAASTTKKTTPTVKPTTPPTNHPGSTPATTPQRPPSAVKIIVLNAGAPAHAATRMSAALTQKGYTNHALPNDWTGHKQKGNTVLCRAGLDREGSALAIAVGTNATLQIPIPSPNPPNTASRDCVVVVGS